MLVVEFCPRRTSFGPDEPTDGHPPGSDAPPDDGHTEEEDYPDAGDPRGSNASSSTRPDAGTGGTQRVTDRPYGLGSQHWHSRASQNTGSSDRCNKWRHAFPEDARRPGTRGTTTVCRSTNNVLNRRAAVCGLLVGCGCLFVAYCSSEWRINQACETLVAGFLLLLSGAFSQRGPVGRLPRAFPFVVCALLLIPGAIGGRLQGDSFQPCPATVRVAPAADKGHHRPVPTPLRNTRLCIGGPHGSQYEGRVRNFEAVLSQTIGPCRTLLQEATARPDSEAMLLASTLLDTLVEFFGAQCAGQSRGRTHVTSSVDKDTSPGHAGCQSRSNASTILSLETCLPLTDFQRHAFQLLDLVPAPPASDARYLGQDWLDADLSLLCQDSYVPIEWRKRFATIPSWHKEGMPTPERLAVYTDGSASSGSPGESTAPASWAFTVWAIVAGRALFVGGSAHTLVPEGTPFFVGEMSDSSLEAELAALTWAL